MKPKFFRSGFPLLVVAAFASSLHHANAASGSWSLNGSGNWATATTANWTGGVVADGADSTASFTNDITAAATVTLTENRTIGNLAFDDAGATGDVNWTLLRSAGTVIPTLETTTGTPTITVTNTATLGNSANGLGLAGTQGFIKTGPGTLVLADNNTNTYGGITTVNQGVLQLGASGVFGRVGSGSTEISVASGATVQFYQGAAVSQLISGAGNVSATSGVASTTTLSGLNTYTGTTTVGGNTLAANTLANGGLSSSIGASSSAATNLVFASGTLLYNGVGAATTDRLMQIGTTAAGGSATFSNNAALSTDTVTFSNTGAVTWGTINQTRTIGFGGSNTGANVFSPAISDNGTGVVSLTKSGAGSWTLTNTNAFTGATTVNAGTLVLDYGINNTNKISATNPVTLGAGSRLAFVGNASASTSQQVKGLTLGSASAGLTLSTAAGQNLSVDFTANSGVLTRSGGSLEVIVTGSGTSQIKVPGTTASTAKVPWATYNGAFAATDASNNLVAGASSVLNENDLSLWTSGTNHYVNTAAWTNSVGPGVAIDGFTFNSPVASTVTIGTGNSLTVNQGIIVSSLVGANVSTVTGGSILGPSGGSLAVSQNNTASNLTIASTLANNGGSSLLKEGPGTLILTGESNPYAGGTIVNGGELQSFMTTAAGTKSPFGTGAVTVNSGATLRLKTGSTGNAMSYANALNLNNANLIGEDGVVTVTGATAFSGSNSINVVWGGKTLNLGGTITGTGTLTLANTNASTFLISGTSTYSGALNVNANATFSVPATGSVTGLGVINLNNNGSAINVGGTLSSGAVFGNAATTTVTVNAGGTFTSASYGTFYTANNAINGTFNPGSIEYSTNSTSTISGSGTINTGSFTIRNFSTVNFTNTGTMNVSGNLFLGNASTQSGSLTQSAGTVNVTTTTGTSFRIGHWASTGSTYTVSGGTLNVPSIDVNVGWDGSGILTTSGGTTNVRGLSLSAAGHTAAGTFNLNGGTVNVGTGGIIKGGGTATVNLGAGTLGARGANWSSSLPMTLNASTTPIFNTLDSVDGATGRTITLSGILSGTGGLAKSGTGTLVLSGANTFSGGATVNGGTLDLNYATQNNSKLADAGVLTLGMGSLVTLTGGSHVETVASTTVNGNASISRPSGTSTVYLKALTFGSAGVLNLPADGLATTDSLNNSGGILSNVLVNGAWALNATNAAGGAINAVTAYTDVDNMGGTIATSPTSNVRLVSAGAGTNVTLATTGTTDIASLTNSVASPIASTVSLGADTLRFSSGSGILNQASAGALTFSGGTITSGTGAVDTNGTLVLHNASTANNLTVSSVIANNGTGIVTVTKTGAGNVVLGGANTFTGALGIAEGTLTLSNATAAGTTAGGVTVSTGATLAFQGPITVGAEAVTLSGQGAGNNGVIRNVSGNSSLSGAITMTASSRIQSDAGTLTLSGIISGSGLTLTKEGAGALAVSSGSADSLPTTVVVNQGTLQISGGGFGSNRMSGNGSLTVKPGAILNLSNAHALGGDNATMTESVVVEGTMGINVSGDGQYFNNLTLRGATVSTSTGTGRLRTSSASNIVVDGTSASSVAAVLQLQNAANFNVADVTASTAADLTLTGGISDSGGALNKSGAGTMVLTGTSNQTTATNVLAGTLMLNNATGTATGTGTVNVSAGATLAGTGGSTGAVNITGTVAPGNLGIGTLKTGALTVTGTVASEINGATNDSLAVTGNLTLTGATLSLTTPGAGATQQVYVLATYTGTLTGSFATVNGLPTGYSVYHNATAKQIELVSSGYVSWTTLFPGLGGNTAKADNPDNDGLNNFGEYAFDGDPTSAVSSGKIVSKVVTLGGDEVVTLTLPVRAGATFTAPASTEQLSAAVDGVIYHIQGSDELADFDLEVLEVTGVDATAIQTSLNLPPLSGAGWTYRTFRLAETVDSAPRAFLRAKVTE